VYTEGGAVASIDTCSKGALYAGKNHHPPRSVFHALYVVFQIAEVAIPRRLFRAIMERTHRLWLPEAVPR
jgi:hypothetical protein